MGEYDDYEPGRVFGEARSSGLLGVTFKWGCIIVGTLVLMSVCTGVVGYFGGWWDTGVKVISPANVTEQFRAAYDDMNSLNAVAANVCTLVKSRDSYPKGSDAYIQRDSQIQAQEQNYQRIANHYNAYIHDPFRAKIVRPRDLPDPAPTLVQSMDTACPGNVV